MRMTRYDGLMTRMIKSGWRAPNLDFAGLKISFAMLSDHVARASSGWPPQVYHARGYEKVLSEALGIASGNSKGYNHGGWFFVDPFLYIKIKNIKKMFINKKRTNSTMVFLVDKPFFDFIYNHSVEIGLISIHYCSTAATTSRTMQQQQSQWQSQQSPPEICSSTTNTSKQKVSGFSANQLRHVAIQSFLNLESNNKFELLHSHWVGRCENPQESLVFINQPSEVHMNSSLWTWMTGVYICPARPQRSVPIWESGSCICGTTFTKNHSQSYILT